jgi:hypothetical protein
MITKRSVLATFASVAVLSLGLAGPAAAQTQQEGLVNVNIENVTVQVPIGVAANICDVNAAILAEQRRAGGARCEATAESVATRGPGNGGGTQQEGLVNVNAEDIVIQLPVTVAANVCDVNVGVLARQLRRGGAECTATPESIATVPEV